MLLYFIHFLFLVWQFIYRVDYIIRALCSRSEVQVSIFHEDARLHFLGKIACTTLSTVLACDLWCGADVIDPWIRTVSIYTHWSSVEADLIPSLNYHKAILYISKKVKNLLEYYNVKSVYKEHKIIPSGAVRPWVK